MEYVEQNADCKTTNWPGNYTFAGLHCMNFLQVCNCFFLYNFLVEFKLSCVFPCIAFYTWTTPYLYRRNIYLSWTIWLDSFQSLIESGKKGFYICQAYLHCKYHYSTLFDVFKCLPEKIAYISWRNNWFPCEITSDKRAQKFHTDDASLLRGYCFWLAETNFPSWHDQSEALLRSG